MRQPLRSKGRAPRARVVNSQTIPAPVGGWNARDSLAQMKPNEAVTLLNWFPRTSYCEIRGGNSEHVTGMVGTGKTLAVYNALNGSNKMFCSTASGVYEVTSAGVLNNYLSLAGASGDYASTPDSAALDITGDIDLIAHVAATDYSTGGQQMIISKWDTTGNQRSYYLAIGTAGNVDFAWTTAGTLGSLTIVSIAPTTAFVDGSAYWVRMTMDVNDGSGNRIVRLYTSSDGVTWTLNNTSTTAGTTSIFSGTALINIGGQTSGTLSRFTGKIFAAKIYNGIGGTLVASFSANDAAVGATSVVSSATGETYTCNGTSVIAGPQVVTSGVTSGKWQTTMFGDGTSNYLIMCNGADKPLYYDGTNWIAVDNASSPALTGITTTNLIAPGVFKGRLLFLAKQSLSFWYLNAGVAGGALTEFDLSAECTRGGYLMAFANWTIDGGNGSDDRAVFVTSEGEVIVYQGNNPSNSAAWSKVGAYYVGQPLGRRCVTQVGGDLVILTQNGAFPLSAGLQSASIDYKAALSNLIETAFTDAARSYGSTFGWEATIYPARSAMIVNIPVSEGGEHKQYVMNTITRKWCEFDSWDAEAFAVFNSELYFVSGTAVYKAWTGANDNGSNIVAYGKQAFSNFGTSMPKQVVMYRPVLATDGPLSFLTDIDVDFGDDDLIGTATYSVSSSSLWGSAVWGESVWAAGLQITKEWTSPNEWAAVWISGKIKVATNSLTVQWISSDYIYQPAENPMG